VCCLLQCVACFSVLPASVCCLLQCVACFSVLPASVRCLLQCVACFGALSRRLTSALWIPARSAPDPSPLAALRSRFMRINVAPGWRAVSTSAGSMTPLDATYPVTPGPLRTVQTPASEAPAIPSRDCPPRLPRSLCAQTLRLSGRLLHRTKGQRTTILRNSPLAPATPHAMTQTSSRSSPFPPSVTSSNRPTAHRWFVYAHKPIARMANA
jgi:hypothetical protein